MERPAELPEIVADLAEMEVVEPLREHVAVAAGLPAVAPVLSANIWLRALRARFTGAWRTGRLGRPKRLFDDFSVVYALRAPHKYTFAQFPGS